MGTKESELKNPIAAIRENEAPHAQGATSTGNAGTYRFNNYYRMTVEKAPRVAGAEG
jgi:hypothetical protein